MAKIVFRLTAKILLCRVLLGLADGKVCRLPDEKLTAKYSLPTYLCRLSLSSAS